MKMVAPCEMTGVVRGGVFYADDKRSLLVKLSLMPEGPAILRIEPAGRARSLADNRRYWATLRAIAMQTGHSDEELHEYYKQKFNRSQSTTALDELSFRTYVDHVMADAAIEHGVSFPGPEPVVGA